MISVRHMALEDRSDRINHQGARYVYEQLAADLEADITAGRLTPDTKLPTEIELAGQYGVGRISARRALQELAAKGLVTIVHGRGTFVSERPQA